MTTLKRIMAVVLAVMLIASIGVIGASAADPTLTFDATGDDAKGFTFDIYQVATLNTTTGQYTSVNNDVAAVVNTKEQSGADFLAAIQALEEQGKIGSVTVNDLSEDTYKTTTAGIYYVKVDGTPENPTKKKDVIIVWPQASDGTYTMSDLTVNLSEKVSSSTVTVTKAFAENDAVDGATGRSLGQVDGTNTVEFLLSASVAGSAAKPATEYVIWDEMCKGLTFNKSSVKVYYDEVKDANDKTTQFTVSDGTAATTGGAYAGGTRFTVTPKDLSATSDFYNHTTVFVKYTATLNKDAVVAPQANPNKDGLTFTVDGSTTNKNGPERKVYTYNLKIKKIDGNDNSPLKDAEFDLKLNGNTIAHGVSDANGIVEFKATRETAPIKLAPGSYTVVETKAAPGYAKNTDVIPVSIADTKGNTTPYADLAAAIEVPNYPTKLPETGGMGTWMFTIGGIALILAAGVMFVIIMKKKASSK